MRRFRRVDYTLESKQNAFDDGTLHYQNRAFTKKLAVLGTKTIPSASESYAHRTEYQNHMKLIDLVQKFPPDIFSKLVLRDERIMGLPR